MLLVPLLARFLALEGVSGVKAAALLPIAGKVRGPLGKVNRESRLDALWALGDRSVIGLPPCAADAAASGGLGVVVQLGKGVFEAPADNFGDAREDGFEVVLVKEEVATVRPDRDAVVRLCGGW